MTIYNSSETENYGFFKIKKFINFLSDKQHLTDVSAFGAFEIGTVLRLCLFIDRRAGACLPMLHLYSDKLNSESSIDQRMNFKWNNYANGFDEYILDLTLSELGLYFYDISYSSKNGKKYIQNPIALNDFEKQNFQLLVHERLSDTLQSFQGGIIYQIFCDRFYRSIDSPPLSALPFGKEYAETVTEPADAVPKYAKYPGAPLDCCDFFGGDLYGICEKLEYLSTLGVSIIYLNPIFDAHSNHKYDTGDYLSVDSMFGGNIALKKLIEAAKKYDIRIILDGVFNHSGDDSIYFNRYGRYDSVGAYNSKQSKYFNWYTFNEYPENYNCWWGIKLHPEFNKSNPAFREFVFGESGIIRHYLKLGIAGWRLDVADELPDDFIKGIKKAAKDEAPNNIIIGEVWEDASNKVSLGQRRKYLHGKELDSVMNYPLRSAIINFLLYGNSELLYKVSASLYSHYPKAVSDVMMNILGTHDTERILSVLSGKNVSAFTADQLAEDKLDETERKLAVDRLKLGYLILATLPGLPSIYYGDEAGLEGWRDPFCRRFFPWGKELKELLCWYRKIGKLRRNEPVFKDGIYQPLYYNDGILIFSRYSDTTNIYESEKKTDNSLNNEQFCNIIVIINNSGKDLRLKLDRKYTELVTQKELSDFLTLPSLNAAILKNTP